MYQLCADANLLAKIFELHFAARGKILLRETYRCNVRMGANEVSRLCHSFSVTCGASKMGDAGTGVVTKFRHCTELCTLTAGTNRYFSPDFPTSRIKFIHTIIQDFLSLNTVE